MNLDEQNFKKNHKQLIIVVKQQIKLIQELFFFSVFDNGATGPQNVLSLELKMLRTSTNNQTLFCGDD